MASSPQRADELTLTGLRPVLVPSAAEPATHAAPATPARIRLTALDGSRGKSWTAPVVDLAFALTGCLAAVRLLETVGAPVRFSAWEPLAGAVSLYGAVVVLSLMGLGLYDPVRILSTSGELRRTLQGLGIATVVCALFAFFADSRALRPEMFLVGGAVGAALTTGWRAFARHRVVRKVTEGRSGRNVLIVGSGKSGQAMATLLRRYRQLGYSVVGFVDERRQDGVLGRPSDLLDIARTRFVDEVWIAPPYRGQMVQRVLSQAAPNGMEVKLLLDLGSRPAAALEAEDLARLPLVSIWEQRKPSLALPVKRAVDIVGAACALVLLSPLMAVVALLVKWESPGPALYRAIRVGKKGRHFACYKFRTMVQNADELKASLRHLNKREGPFFKVEDDPRVTRFGRLLRKYSLDELPQFWNVLTGEMSLVGPRPHPLDDYRQYRPEHLRRLTVLPGITGLWQITARRDPSFARNMALDLEYIENWSLWLDFKILLMTLPAALQGGGE